MTANAKTIYGEIEGIEKKDHFAFLGVPFAKPPVGELRFKAPQPPEPWNGIREAKEFGAAAPQMKESYFPAMSPEKIEEDCLYLNVWTPRADGEKRPVMVWIHGGGFLSGAGSLPWYRGHRIAATNDVVVVSINYRLGALGFLYLNELAGDDLSPDSNIGIRDQIAALEWVRDNIENFGGDPGNVTIFGESAGGMSVGTLLGTPAAKGLFHRAIMQSGAAHNMVNKDQATVIAERFLEMSDIHPSDTAGLRGADWNLFLSKYLKITAFTVRTLLGFLPFEPVVDDDLIPKPAKEALFDGLSADVPVMAGTNADEWNLFAITQTDLTAITEENLAQRFERQLVGGDTAGREHARQIWEVYEKEADSEEEVPGLLMTDVVFRIPAIRACETQSQHQPATYQYLFTYGSPAAPNGKPLGAFHGLEIPFVFGIADRPDAAFLVGTNPAIPDLSKTMQSAWVEFARTGKPAADGLPEWPSYDLETRPVMILDTEPRVDHDPESVRRQAWEGIL